MMYSMLRLTCDICSSCLWELYWLESLSPVYVYVSFRLATKVPESSVVFCMQFPNVFIAFYPISNSVKMCLHEAIIEFLLCTTHAAILCPFLQVCLTGVWGVAFVIVLCFVRNYPILVWNFPLFKDALLLFSARNRESLLGQTASCTWHTRRKTTCGWSRRPTRAWRSTLRVIIGQLLLIFFSRWVLLSRSCSTRCVCCWCDSWED